MKWFNWILYILISLFFLKGEKTFFLQPGERLANGIQDVYVLEEDEGLILRCTESFKEDEVNWFCFFSL